MANNYISVTTIKSYNVLFLTKSLNSSYWTISRV